MTINHRELTRRINEPTQLIRLMGQFAVQSDKYDDFIKKNGIDNLSIDIMDSRGNKNDSYHPMGLVIEKTESGEQGTLSNIEFFETESSYIIVLAPPLIQGDVFVYSKKTTWM